MNQTGENTICEEMVRNTLISIKLAPTICLAGPSGNGKSTAMSFLLPEDSNKHFSKNIGDSSQTSLIRTKVYINDSVKKGYVYVKGIKRTDNEDYKFQVQLVITKRLYDSRDELEEFTFTEEDLQDIFNPKDKSYHIANYIKDKQVDVSELVEILNDLCNNIINGDISLVKEAKDLLKKLKVEKKSIKLIDCFERVVEQRFNKQDNMLSKIDNWFKELESIINEDFKEDWTIQKENIWYGLESSEELGMLMNKIYNSNSPFSLVFSELQYVVAPTDEMQNIYHEVYKKKFPNKPLRVCILDTPGVTQTGGTQKIIQNEIEKILSLKMDALLFLCASDEKDTIYQYCMQALIDNRRNISSIPVTICRTKLDIIIRNKLVNINREKTGKNVIDDENFKDFLTEAYKQFVTEFIENNNIINLGDNTDNNNKPIECVSLAPDMTQRYKAVLPKEFSERHIIEIILELSLAVDKKYSENGFVKIESRDRNKSAISIRCNKKEIDVLVKKIIYNNIKHHMAQYTKYISNNSMQYCFATRSINTFRNKHKLGYGHETHAQVYDNFKLYIIAMLQRWINEFFNDLTDEDISNFYLIDFTNMICKDEDDRKLAEGNMCKASRITFTKDKNMVVNSIARQIGYDGICDELDKCYYGNSPQKGFENILRLFFMKFNDSNYLSDVIEKAISAEILNRVLKTCIID